MTQSTVRPKIAVIGCGAIVESLYAPALQRHSPALSLVCYDRDERRALQVAQSLGAERWATDYRDGLEDVDGAIVAVPASLHHEVAMQCLSRGVHVLCEKPLATSPEQAEELVDAADRNSIALSVNNGRRLFPAFRETARLVAAGSIGTPRKLKMQLGEQFDWPAASASYFGVAAGGKGVLLDIGAHVLDLVCWWLEGKPTITDYADDSLGGTEAYAVLDFVHQRCTGRITLSWLSRLQNRFTIIGDEGAISSGIYDWRSLNLTTSGRTARLRLPSTARTISELGYEMVDNFLDVVAGKAAPLVSGRDVLPSIQLISECYSRRRRVAMPWYDAMERVLNAS